MTKTNDPNDSFDCEAREIVEKRIADAAQAEEERCRAMGVTDDGMIDVDAREAASAAAPAGWTGSIDRDERGWTATTDDDDDDTDPQDRR